MAIVIFSTIFFFASVRMPGGASIKQTGMSALHFRSCHYYGYGRRWWVAVRARNVASILCEWVLQSTHQFVAHRASTGEGRASRTLAWPAPAAVQIALLRI